jgi:TonB family protein
MASLFFNSRRGWSTLALVVGCLAALPPAAGQTKSGPKGPLVVDPKKVSRLVLNQVIPEYPTLAKVNYIQGQVRVQLEVTREGRVRHAHVLHGHPFLAASALKAVRRWLYLPLMTAVGPSNFLTVVNVNFSLRIWKVELLPREPEKDLDRRIQPPIVLEKTVEHAPTSSVRLRLLLGDDGQIIDSEPVEGPATEYEAARKSVERWTFRPARWGTLRVPWYLDVDVPVVDRAIHQGAAGPGAQ